MGSGRGDRNQSATPVLESTYYELQWGPVVVTGIRWLDITLTCLFSATRLQWGPVVVTGIRRTSWSARALLTLLQWGPVVVTGISDSLLNCTLLGGKSLQWGPVVVTGISARSDFSPR